MKPLHIRTPIIESHALSKIAGCQVLLKLENVQPTASFKLRGLGKLCQTVSLSDLFLVLAKNAHLIGISDVSMVHLLTVLI